MKKLDTKELKTPNAFIDYSKTTDDVYENLQDYNPTRKRRALTVFDDMIADMEAKKNKSYNHWSVYKRKKTQLFTFFFITTLFQGA